MKVRKNLTQKPWLKPELERLKKIINNLMEIYGYVDIPSIANEFERTQAALKRKLWVEGIDFKVKPTIPTPVFSYRGKDDMRTLPKHTHGKLKGRDVDYRRYV